ncbi:MAG: hypothetical protein AAGD38_19675, partial [Acidobacteriota bacterium]
AGETLGLADAGDAVTVRDNLFVSTTGWEACWWIGAGHGTTPLAAGVSIANNTCAAAITRHAAIVVGNPEGDDPAIRLDDLQLEANLITGLGDGDLNLLATYAPAAWRVDGNVYAPAGGFRLVDDRVPSLDAWRELGGVDAESRVCEVPVSALEGAVDETLAACLGEAGATRR